MTSDFKFNDQYTEYADAARSPIEQIMVDKWNIETGTDTLSVLDAVPDLILILNSNRQAVYANKAAINYIGQRTGRPVYGLRPGEAIGCVHAFETGSGCGTSHFCSTCGAVNSILQSIKGTANMEECRITETITGEPLDLRVWTTPVSIKDETYNIFVFSDIANEKRRNVLERIFFHDILNLAGSLKGLAFLFHEPEEDFNELIGLLEEVSTNLISEIQAQKILLDAENEKLDVVKTRIDSLSVIKSVANIYRKHNAATGRTIVIDEGSRQFEFSTDVTLLKRVLANMTKNALEASRDGGKVSIKSELHENQVTFSVHNNEVMPEEIQLQVFQRSFSTKGIGRGLGTYSIKLLGEKYLGGKVGFVSDENTGTTFFIQLPVNES